MLTFIAILAAVLLVGAAMIQWVISLLFRRSFTKRSVFCATSNRQKKVAVVISVRGCDPTLGDSIRGILNQDYENYVVHLVIDHQTDPAWEYVHEIKMKHDQRDVLAIHEMQNPPETCSLKCHSIVQALARIDDESKIIAFLDADVSPHATWISELTGPLEDPSIGAVTGCQWFEPPVPAGIGSLVRSAWNGGAMVPTIHYANPWAGSFAMRVDDIHQSNLSEIWSRSAVDDGPIREAISRLGLKIEFAPSLIMVNREPCSLAYVNRWVTRMLTWSRLYEKTFYLTAIHALFSNVAMLGNFVILLVAILVGSWLAGAISATGLIASGLLSVAAYGEARKCAAFSCSLRGEKLSPVTGQRLAGVFVLVAMAQWVFGRSCFRALRTEQIQWRGIDYEIGGGQEIRRLNYQPYLPDTTLETRNSI